MKWDGQRASENVEDRRGGGGLATGGRHIGLGGAEPKACDSFSTDAL